MYNPLGLPPIYNPLGPWNIWFVFSSQAMRVWTGTLRGITEGWAKANAETDRIVTGNIIDAEARFSEAANRATKHRVAKEASAIPTKRDRRNRHRVVSDRVAARVKKNQKRRRRA